MIELHLVVQKNPFFKVKISYAGASDARDLSLVSTKLTGSFCYQCLYRTFGKTRENLEGDSTNCLDTNLAS